MAEPSRYSDSSERTGVPRWLKLSILVLVLAALVVGALLFTGVLGGGGGHPRPEHGAVSQPGGPADRSWR